MSTAQPFNPFDPFALSSKTYPRYEYWQSKKNNQWFWHYQTANGKIVAAGEGYQNKADCISAIALLKGSAGAPAVEISGT